MEALKPGDPGVVGRYRLSARLAGGRLGTVFLGKAKDRNLVAVRLVRPDLAADKRFVERFRKTTEAVRRVDGLHLAHVLDADPDGTPPWLVTEYAPGLTLEAAVRDHGPLPEESLRALGSALSRALVAIHAAKVVHQGLAAGTVMLTQDGPQITDLGVPALLGADASTALPAPEQATGGTVTAATDVFALAGLICHAAGVAPYGEVGAAELAQKVLRTTPDLEGLPEDLAALVGRCLARRPDSRPTAAELAELFDGEDATGTAWLPRETRAAVTEAASVKPPKSSRATPKKTTAATAARGADDAATSKARGSDAPPAAEPIKATGGTVVPDAEEVDADGETVEVGVALAVSPRAAVPDEPDAAEADAEEPSAERGDDEEPDARATPAAKPGADKADTATTAEGAPGENGTAPAPAASPSAPADPGSDRVAAATPPRSDDSGDQSESAPSDVPTVKVEKPLDQPRLVKPRKPEAAPPAPAEPPTPVPASAAAATAASAPTALATPAVAAPAATTPRWSPAGPAEAAPPHAAPTVVSRAPASTSPTTAPPAHGPADLPADPQGLPAAPPQPKRQASAAVWYAVIALVGLTSVGLAVYRLVDSEWRDLQNPFMGMVLPGVALLFGLAGVVVLALAVSDRRKASGDAGQRQGVPTP